MLVFEIVSQAFEEGEGSKKLTTGEGTIAVVKMRNFKFKIFIQEFNISD